MDTSNPIKVANRGEEKKISSFSPHFIMNKIDLIIKKIKQNSQMPIEGESLLRSYIYQSLKKGRPITFYNWECPPRILDMDKKGKLFINYCVDLGKIFRGEKLDEYTEIPRIVKEKERENKTLGFLKSLGLKFRLVKVIADTNAYYITPYSLKVSGKKKIKKIFFRFKRKIEIMLKKDYSIAETKAYLFTTLIKEYQKEYEGTFSEALKILDSDVSKLIKLKTWNQQLQYIKRHLGFKEYQQREIIDFTKRTIATYAAEGIMFNLLAKTKKFSNCVWLNIEEVDQKTIEITNCLRKRKNLGKLPIIFPKKGMLH